MLRFLLHGSSSGPTHARASIRESLRIFMHMEQHLQKATKPSLLFEQLVTKQTHRITFDASRRSCGLTSQCFAALFFSKDQMTKNHHLAYTNGTDLQQLWGNPNLVVYALWRQWPRRRIGSFPKHDVSKVLRYQATQNTNALSSSLLRIDEPQDLPRVVFCNMSWVLLDELDMEHEDVSLSIKDHQWVIVKHGNNFFQIVQGYKDTAGREGYCLSKWQANERGQVGSGKWTGTLVELQLFLSKIQSFASSSTFDAPLHSSLFGVNIQDTSSTGSSIWPAVSFRDLDDDSIDGHGCRFVANGVERDLKIY